ncbi:MAG TPA: MFS transporter [Allocoleopsis sp.]
MNITDKFPAFHSKNYRLFFIGQGLSLIGSWMSQTSSIWLVYHLTKSPSLLGLVAFSSQIPSVILLPIAGVISDRINRHKFILLTQVLSMIVIAILTTLCFTKTINVVHLFIISFISGTISAFDVPVRQSFISELVEQKQDLPNAIALNASMFNGARLIGPAIAGIMIAKIGVAYCYLIDSISYLAVLIAFISMRIKNAAPKTNVNQTKSGFETFKEGWKYTFNDPLIKLIIFLLAFMSFMGFQYTVLNPIFAKGDPEILGYLMSASGIGAFTGAIYLSSRKKELFGLIKYIAFAPIFTGIGLMIYAYSPFLWLSLIMMFAVGLSFILQFVSSNTLIQTIVDDDKRGRVLSIYALAFFGILPFGGLYAGFSAKYIGANNTLLIAGLCCVLFSSILSRKLLKIKLDIV